MQKILWIGKPYFAPALLDCGFEQVAMLPVAPDAIYTWKSIVELAGFTPDILVVADSQKIPFVLGMENFPCITIFYSVHSHLHSWHGPYAQAFDVCIATQHGHTERLAGPFLARNRIWQLPPFAPDDFPPDRERDIDCMILASPNPGRKQFIDALKHHIPCLSIHADNQRELYSRARIVVQYTGERMGIDFQTFYAISAGACVVTPRVNHGLEKLFIDGEHLVGYAPRDAGDAAYRINFLLDNPELIAHIGRTGQAEVRAKHLASHRAWSFTEQVCDLAMQDTSEIIRRRKANAGDIRKNCLAVPYLLCARSLSEGHAQSSFYAAIQGKEQ